MNFIKNIFKIFLFALLAASMATSPGIVSAETENVVAGESIHYDIRKFGVKVGDAEFVFKGPATKDNKPFLLLTFTSRAMKFLDEEKIYMDPTTFYPMIVERDLNIFGKKEKIREDYVHEAGEVRITKSANGKTIRQVVHKTGPIDNVYCFIYRFRQKKEMKENQAVLMNLPTKDVVVKFLRQEKLKINGKNTDAVLMESDPSGYDVWFDVSPAKIPLRIDGSLGLARTSLIYTSTDKDKK